MKQEDHDIKNKMIEMNRQLVLDLNQRFHEQTQKNNNVYKLIKQIQKTN